MFGLGRFFDRAKGVAIAAVAAGLLAIAGVALLAASAAWMLSQWMTWPAALAVSGVGFLAVAAIAMWVGVQPKRGDHHHQPEPDDVDPTAAALAMLELPVEVAKKIISERPLAATVAIAGIGLLIARKPQIAMKMVDKLLERFGGVE